MHRFVFLLALLIGCHRSAAPTPRASSDPMHAAPTPCCELSTPPAPSASSSASVPEAPKEHLLGVFTTKFRTNTGDGRADNIALAAGLLDGLIVKPGEEVSFNHVVGPRTTERGFKNAPTIVMGEVFEGVGGGTCQVSSTLYTALLNASVEVTERRHHSRPSHYITPGLDAAVNYPAECAQDDPLLGRPFEKKPDPKVCYDLKFKNTYDFPISVHAGVEEWCVLMGVHPVPNTEECLFVALWGTGSVPWTDHDWHAWETPPFEKRYRRVPYWHDDRKQLKQAGAPGLKGVLTITTWADLDRKTLLSKREVYSEYQPVPEVWEVGEEWKDGGGT